MLKLTGKQGRKLDIPQIPELLIDNTDRNRTSPFAFTGNRFEFRAVGSEANCAAAMIVLNTAMAEALVNFKERVDERIAGGKDKVKAILEVLREDIVTSKPVRFDGNGYSKEWEEEAKKRGLDCESSAPLAYDQYLAPESVKMFESMHVMTRNELQARNEIKWETYTKKIQIEGRVFGDMAINHIIPMATRYQSALIDNVVKMRSIFPVEKADKLSENNLQLIEQIAEHTSYIHTHVKELVNNRSVANKLTNPRQRAIAYHDTVAPVMEDIREHIDRLEEIVEDEMWTLPKYREMLFIH